MGEIKAPRFQKPFDSALPPTNIQTTINAVVSYKIFYDNLLDKKVITPHTHEKRIQSIRKEFLS